MDRSERMKRITAFIVAMQMQTQTLMIQLLIIAFVYLRTRRRSGRFGGSQAEFDSDMDEQVHQEDDQQNEEDAMGMSDEAPDESQFPSQQSTSMTSTAQNMKRKKPCSPTLSPDEALFKSLCDTIKYLINQQGKNLEALARAMADPQEEKNVGQMLKDLGFDDHEIVTAALKFSENPLLAKNLWGLSDDLKVKYVRAILSR